MMVELAGVRRTEPTLQRDQDAGTRGGLPQGDRDALRSEVESVTRIDAMQVAQAIAPADGGSKGVTRAEAPKPGNNVGGIGQPFDRIRPASEVANELLETNRGIFVGEEHVVGHPAQKLMMSSMKDFAQRGVKVLGLEAFDREQQPILDKYQNDPSSENREAVLKASKWEVGAEEWVKMIDEANRNGIRVVGMDTAARRTIGHGLSAKEVNTRWAQSIESALQQAGPGAKFVAYGGLLHSSAPPWQNGVNQILGVPSIVPGNPNFYLGDYRMPGGGWGIAARNDLEYYAVDTTPP